MITRRVYHLEELDVKVGGFAGLWGALLFGEDKPPKPVSNIENANLTSSKTLSGKHAPVIDLDVPHRLVPSSSPGHAHLYLDVETSWPRYVLLLLALRLCGVIERGHCYWSIRRGATYVRLPWIRK